MPMDRFRPNVVIRGLPAFAEHARLTLRGAAWALELCDPCERCVMTTIDQASAERHPTMQPYRTLVSLNPMPDAVGKPAFGQNALVSAGVGTTIRVGDRLRVAVR